MENGETVPDEERSSTKNTQFSHALDKVFEFKIRKNFSFNWMEVIRIGIGNSRILSDSDNLSIRSLSAIAHST